MATRYYGEVARRGSGGFWLTDQRPRDDFNPYAGYAWLEREERPIHEDDDDRVSLVPELVIEIVIEEGAPSLREGLDGYRARRG